MATQLFLVIWKAGVAYGEEPEMVECSTQDERDMKMGEELDIGAKHVFIMMLDIIDGKPTLWTPSAALRQEMQTLAAMRDSDEQTTVTPENATRMWTIKPAGGIDEEYRLNRYLQDLRDERGEDGA